MCEPLVLKRAVASSQWVIPLVQCTFQDTDTFCVSRMIHTSKMIMFSPKKVQFHHFSSGIPVFFTEVWACPSATVFWHLTKIWNFVSFAVTRHAPRLRGMNWWRHTPRHPSSSKSVMSANLRWLDIQLSESEKGEIVALFFSFYNPWPHFWC